MTTELTGRALDKAAAVAMGWRCLAKTPSPKSKWTDGKTLEHPGPTPQMALPRFHTDPATIPEMLAWLHAEGTIGCVILGCYEGKVNACASKWVSANIHTEGTTPNEALARLVVAVAAAKGAK